MRPLNRRAFGVAVASVVGSTAGLVIPSGVRAQSEVEQALEWGIRQGLPRAWAYRVAWCESRYDPLAYNPNGRSAGLFQFIPSTWARSPQGKRGESPYNVWSNVAATVWLYFAPGGGPRHWSCK